MNDQQIASLSQARDHIQDTKRLLVLTGAGMSAECGMPTYRGPTGIFTTNPTTATRLTARGLADDPDRVWDHVNRMRILASAAEPSPAHRVLAEWERDGKFPGFLIATQNIDGIHQRAGNQRVSELHGSIWQLARPRCVEFSEDEEFSDDYLALDDPDERELVLKRWSEENQMEIWEDRVVPIPIPPPFRPQGTRPNILLFDEPYGCRLLWVEDFIQGGIDTVLVAGCSGAVSILASLLYACRDANPDCAIININPHEDSISLPHLHVPLGASAAFEALGGD
jgi:NAD-dependent SIR2 family protein deacetylase